MIELIDFQLPRVVGMRISGKIDEPELSKIFEAIKEKLEHSEKLGIYVELESFGGISWDALIEDLKFGLPHIKRFDKKAVVSDEDWMGKMVEFADKIFSGIQIRHFTLEEKEEAKKWVAE